MKHMNNIRGRIVAAAIMATGVAVLWGIACGWIGTLASGFATRSRVNENLQIALDGTPVISVTSYGSYSSISLSRRTIDGQPWPNDYETWLGSARLDSRSRRPGLYEFAPQWRSYGARIGGGSDGKKPPTAWYIVRSDEQPGKALWMGYNPMSKLPVGYIGIRGFRDGRPPLNEHFDLPSGDLGRLNQFVASSQYLNYQEQVYFFELTPDARPAAWLGFMIDDHQLWQVDLRERSARVVAEVPGACSVEILRTREELVETMPDATSAQRKVSARYVSALQDTLLPSGSFTVTFKAEEPPRMAGLVAVRTDESIVLYDDTAGKRKQFKLPTGLETDALTVNWIAPEELLISHTPGYWNSGPIQRLLWIAPDGTINREQEVKLQGWVSPSERHEAWLLAPTMPVPAFWAGWILGARPMQKMQWLQADSYADALRKVLEINWPPLLLVAALTIAAVWIAAAWHRKYMRGETSWWLGLVALFGPAGLIAYWLEHRRVKLEACEECRTVVPRDRDACAVCATPFPPPPLVGTEVFA